MYQTLFCTQGMPHFRTHQIQNIDPELKIVPGLL